MGDDLMCFITKKWITLNSESHPSRGVGFSKKPQPALPTAVGIASPFQGGLSSIPTQRIGELNHL